MNDMVKTVSDMFMPLSGEVLEFNEKLEDTPELINTDPYGDGWIIKVNVAEVSELEDLLTADQYKELL